MDEKSLRSHLSSIPVSGLRYFDRIASTNDEALIWAEHGALDGSLVVADEQTAGRGRLNRRWVTVPGAALAFSLVLRPTPAEVEHPGLFSPLGALAVAETVDSLSNLRAEIKWPNDVLLNGRKLCGILLEASWLGERLQAVVIGIGVNLTPGAVPPAQELLFPATSLEDQPGSIPPREQILAMILARLFAWRQKINLVELIHAWERRLAYRGQMVRIEQAGREVLAGRVLGVTAGGELRLQTAAGDEVQVTAGDVRLRPAGEE